MDYLQVWGLGVVGAWLLEIVQVVALYYFITCRSSYAETKAEVREKKKGGNNGSGTPAVFNPSYVDGITDAQPEEQELPAVPDPTTDEPEVPMDPAPPLPVHGATTSAAADDGTFSGFEEPAVVITPTDGDNAFRGFDEPGPCTYTSPTGRSCKQPAGGTSQFCGAHTCPSCTGSKSSSTTKCDICTDGEMHSGPDGYLDVVGSSSS
jgi:hypothetical protein